METIHKYLSVEVETKEGRTFHNPLKLSEVRFITQLAKENKKVTVVFSECDEDYYKCLFG